MFSESAQTRTSVFSQSYENYSLKKVVFLTSKPRDCFVETSCKDFGWGVLVVKKFFIPLVIFHQI